MDKEKYTVELTLDEACAIYGRLTVAMLDGRANEYELSALDKVTESVFQRLEERRESDRAGISVKLPE